MKRYRIKFIIFSGIFIFLEASWGSTEVEESVVTDSRKRPRSSSISTTSSADEKEEIKGNKVVAEKSADELNAIREHIVKLRAHTEYMSEVDKTTRGIYRAHPQSIKLTRIIDDVSQKIKPFEEKEDFDPYKRMRLGYGRGLELFTNKKDEQIFNETIVHPDSSISQLEAHGTNTIERMIQIMVEGYVRIRSHAKILKGKNESGPSSSSYGRYFVVLTEEGSGISRSRSYIGLHHRLDHAFYLVPDSELPLIDEILVKLKEDKIIEESVYLEIKSKLVTYSQLSHIYYECKKNKKAGEVVTQVKLLEHVMKEVKKFVAE